MSKKRIREDFRVVVTPAEQIAEIRTRCEAATDGPWTVEGGGGVHMDGSRDWYHVVTSVHSSVRTTLSFGDADFIAHARQDIPALLADRAELVAEVERLRAVAEETLEYLGYISPLSPRGEVLEADVIAALDEEAGE